MSMRQMWRVLRKASWQMRSSRRELHWMPMSVRIERDTGM
jgi:hypothetical protein